MVNFKKYYPFWLGLIVTIVLIGIFKEAPSFAAIGGFVVGYYKVTKLHD